MRNILLAIALITLSGCAAWDAVTSAAQNIVSPNPNLVATLQATLAAAENAAKGYVDLAPCGTKAANGSSFCSQDSIVQQIQTYNNAAVIAVNAARANENATTITAAQNAVNAYQNIVQSLPTTTAPTVNSSTVSP